MTDTSTAAPSDLATPMGPIDQAAVQAFISQHPELGWMATDPELGPLLQQSATEGWTTEQWQAELQKTGWFKNHAAATRDWMELVGSDPAEAARRVQEEQHNIQAVARNLGINFSDTQLQALSTQALEYGWDAQEIQDTLAKTITFSNGQMGVSDYYLDPNTGKPVDILTGRQAYEGPNGERATPDKALADKTWGSGNYQTADFNGTTVYYKADSGASTGGGPAPYRSNTGATIMPGGGAIGATAQELKKRAASYMVPISDQTLTQWATQIATGQADANSFDAYLAAQAKSMFPTMAQAIDAGITPQQYVDPYKQIAAKLLGMNPDSIDMSQPQWMRAVTQKDPKSGMPTAMSLYDWENTVMQDPRYGYQKSQNAVDRASAFAQALGEMFGQTPGGGTGLSGAAPLRVG